jgi:hypothetical protein
MTAVAHAAKIAVAPDACPKCHAPPNYFSRYPYSVECVCGWTGFFRLPVSTEPDVLETQAERSQRLSKAALSRIRNMTPDQLAAHMQRMQDKRHGKS